MDNLTIDSFGSVLDAQGNPVGFVEDGKCYSLADDSEFQCPKSDDPQQETPIIRTPTVSAKRTYWFVLVGAVLIVAWIVFVLYKWK